MNISSMLELLGTEIPASIVKAEFVQNKTGEYVADGLVICYLNRKSDALTILKRRFDAAPDTPVRNWLKEKLEFVGSGKEIWQGYYVSGQRRLEFMIDPANRKAAKCWFDI